MKKTLPVLILFALLQSISFGQSPIVQSIINQTNLDSLIYFVKELSGEVQTIINGTPYTIVSRNKYQPSNDMAANYIKQKLNSYGLVTYDQWWSSTGRNVYGVQLGSVYPNKKYIICAHYDDMPTGTTAPGADDNASGSAAVLEAARIFTQYDSKYTIIYALWDEEEQGLVGSDYYAHQAYLAGDSIMGVLNMDMTAYDGDGDGVGEIHVRNYGNSFALRDAMVGVNTTYNIGVTPSIQNNGTTASDQASFWNYGYGAILLIEEYFGSDFNPYYHSVNDLLIHYNQPYYHKMSKLVFGTLATIAEMSEIVPVEFLAFTASVNNSGVQLLWSTASELNNHGFEIERSIDDANNFVTVGFIDGKGNSTEINRYSFIDKLNLKSAHEIYYRLKQVDFNGTFNYSNVINVTYNIPEEFVLNQNYPNPFNPSTRITYSIPNESFVSIKLYDFLGREVKTLVNDFQSTGSYEIVFDASELPSGTYFYTMLAGNYSATRKMLVLK